MTAVVNTINDEVIPGFQELANWLGRFDAGFARQMQVHEAMDRISESMGIEGAALDDLRAKWVVYAREGRNWTESTDDLTVAIMDAEAAALALLAPVVEHPAKMRRVSAANVDAAKSAEELEEEAKALNDAMQSLADDGLREVAQGAKEAKRRIRDLLHGGDERKSVRQLRAELRQLERQKRRAANQGRVDAFAAIEQREGEIQAHLRQRGVVRTNMEKFKDAERAKQTQLGMTEGMLNAVTTAVNAIPTKKNVTIDVIGEEQVAAAARMVGNLVAMSGNVVSVFLQGIGTKKPPKPPGEAHGGEVGSGRTYLVGERGPELLTMGSGSGRITPNHRMGGGGGNVYLDGRKVGFILDEELGRRYGMAGAAGSYRRAD
jgi:hypothetical protein